MKAKYPIGFEFTLKRGKQSPQIRKIIDHLFTYNSAGILIKTRYVTIHKFLGQDIADYDVVQTTIDRTQL